MKVCNAPAALTRPRLTVASTMMSAHGEARDQLRRYLDVYPEELIRFQLLSRQLESDAQLFARSNMTGHVTSSAAVLNPLGTKVLLIDHVALKRWLTPGVSAPIQI